MAFQPVEDELQDTSPQSLFQGATSHIPRRAITGLSVKQAGIALPDTTQTASTNWTASCVITGNLVSGLCGTYEFRLGYHSLLTGKVRE